MVLRRVFAAPEFRWRETRSPWQWAGDELRRAVDALGALYRSHPGAYVVVMALLVAVLVTILVHGTYTVVEAFRRRATAERPAAAIAPPRDAAWHEHTARHLSAEGRYAEAVGHRYAALVLRLAARRALVFHPSKTPAEYAAEAKLGADDRSALAALTGALYGYLFGGAPCDAAAWTQFDRSAGALGGHGATA